MTEFKVGDKVEHSHYGAGEVKYGPYEKLGTTLTGYYLVEFGYTDKCLGVHGANLTPAPAFKVGDKVTHRLFPGPFTVHSGPFPYSDGAEGAFYVIEKPDGFRAVSPANLTPYDAPDSGPSSETAGRYYVYDGVAYDLWGRYVDNDGDAWQFAEVTGVCGEMPRLVMMDDLTDGTLAEIVRQFGPLVRI
ncbi:phiSA1p31-related protein [Streptomyces sp. NPDC101393]|uniref:phiSA1p31-related protein n=1 Tax=Streptomyces sp. NPDC101393 TaxID=3366141 RepID=UPI00381C9570